MTYINWLRSFFGNFKPKEKGICIKRRTIVISSACILSSGIAGGIVYKEWQIQSQRQRQIQINNCYFSPPVTPVPESRPISNFIPKVENYKESA